MKVSLFDYNLPQELIAQYPVTPRDSSRLLVLDENRDIHHTGFANISEFIPEGSLLVFNNTKVIPARLYCVKPTGGKVELLLTKGIGKKWKSIFKSSRRPKKGSLLQIIDHNGIKGPEIEVTDSGTEREIEISLPVEESGAWDFLDKYGHVPLPPYIDRGDTENDKSRYQTIYAKSPGAVAAPTAGLHFTPNIIDKLKEKNIDLEYLTLHVGIGTFAPVKVENTKDHIMHSEQFEIPLKLSKKIHSLPENKKIFAVGTTSLRALEGSATGKRTVKPGTGETDIFITPGYEFKVVDSIITNFHLPKSTLLMLISAFRGRETIMSAYKEAVHKKYRFLSYGDAMLLL